MLFLIDDAYLTNHTSVSTSNRDKNIKVALQSVTLINVKPLLGIPLYSLYEAHVATDKVLTSKQAELFELIQYFMALRVEREMMFNVLNVNNKGATQEDHTASIEVVTAKRQDVEAKADFVKRSILKYLGTHKLDFPEFYPEPNQVSAPDPSVYSSAIVFDYEPKKYFM